MPSLRLILVFILLAGQCLIAVWQHLGDTRYFAWAPNDYIMVYEPRVIVGGRKLSDAEVKERYLVLRTVFQSLEAICGALTSHPPSGISGRTLLGICSIEFAGTRRLWGEATTRW